MDTRIKVKKTDPSIFIVHSLIEIHHYRFQWWQIDALFCQLLSLPWFIHNSIFRMLHLSMDAFGGIAVNPFSCRITPASKDTPFRNVSAHDFTPV